uniref:BSD domain-containing protein 1-like n=1 Tax=Saccoglossus kowalevskii TaxID=10224 RepID=A0ABM0MBQ5_SACKO|nr:PREDICTED: BSD domain-containing protein 1-like [Saccoglossus kowalevskii]
MAEGGEGGSWWGGWVQTAKDKSNEAWNFMKKDLVEFGSVVQKDTSAVVATTACTLKDKLKVEESTGSKMRSGFTNFLMGISETLAPKNYGMEEDDDVPQRVIFDRAKARLQDTQTDPGTYLTEPDGPVDVYEEWKETFHVDQHKGDISDLLVASDEVRSIYTKLVNDTWEVTDAVEETVGDVAEKPKKPESPDQSPDKKEIDTEKLETKDVVNQDEVTIKTKEHLEENIGTETKKEEQNNAAFKSEKDDTAKKTEDSVEDTQTAQEAKEHIEGGQEPDKTEPDKTEPDKTELLTGEKALEVNKDKESTTSEGSSIEELRFSDDSSKEKDEADKTVLPVQKDGSGMSSPVQSDNGASKDTSSLSDDWDRDFDIEITEQDLKHVAALATTTEGNEEDLDDWESWE